MNSRPSALDPKASLSLYAGAATPQLWPLPPHMMPTSASGTWVYRPIPVPAAGAANMRGGGEGEGGCVCLYVCACVWVRERGKRESGREGGREGGRKCVRAWVYTLPRPLLLSTPNPSSSPPDTCTLTRTAQSDYPQPAPPPNPPGRLYTCICTRARALVHLFFFVCRLASDSDFNGWWINGWFSWSCWSCWSCWS